MVVENNDPDIGSAVNDVDGDNVLGGSNSFYHYGRNRSNSSDSFNLRVTRNTSLCGDGENTTCTNLNNFTSNMNYTFTNCTYCHQVTEANNNFSGFMNRSDLHSNMLDHSDNTNNPYCTDCHIVYNGENASIRIHDAGLVVPERSYYVGTDGLGMYNSTMCRSCHNQSRYEIHANDSVIGNNTVECSTCHANASNYTYSGESIYGDKQVHGIRYINDSGVYSAAWDQTTAANCTTCHQGNLINTINASPTAGVISIVKIPQPLNHSNNASAGTIWNQTGYLGPWKNPDSNNLRSCLYCHGNVDSTQTSVDDISNIVHNQTALGRVNKVYIDQGSSINDTLSSSKYYCSECHYDGNVNRSDIVNIFISDGFAAPQSIIINDSGDPDYFFNHSEAVEGNSHDRKCSDCHGRNLPGNARMDEFVHNLEIGQGSPDCISCHDIGDSAPGNIDLSVMDLGVHAQLNNRSGDPGTTDTEYNSGNRKCWGCHSNGSTPSLDVNRGMGDNQTTPWQCFDCHTVSGSQYGKYFNTGNQTDLFTVWEHIPNASNIKAATNLITGSNRSLSCISCHNKSEMILPNNDPDTGSSNFPDTDGDGVVGGTSSFYHYGRNRSLDMLKTRDSTICGSGGPTNCSNLNNFPYGGVTYTYTDCSYCHQNATTPFNSSMNLNEPYKWRR
jgi:hypothetical protein